MLSIVLRSKRAILVNVQIIRAFVQMRDLLIQHHDLALRIDSLEKQYDEQFKIVFEAIKRLIAEEDKPPATIGFITDKIPLDNLIPIL